MFVSDIFLLPPFPCRQTGAFQLVLKCAESKEGEGKKC